MRLIDGGALERAIYEWMPKDQEAWMDSDIPPIENLVVSIMMTIQEQPTVDAQPVRHGRWIYLDKDNKFFKKHIVKCSLCNNSLDLYAVNGGRGDANYCPNCGAKMDVEQEEQNENKI